MLKEFRAALVMVVVMTAITGLAYPALVTALANALFPAQAGGSLVARGDTVVGAELIGQPFTQPGYFWGRPSAAGQGYDAANSGASNLAPSSRKLAEDVAARAEAMRRAAPEQTDQVPADLVTASASGLDPHITPEAAAWQVKRVAAHRHAPVAEVRKLVAAHTQGRELGLLGEPRVNVLRINMALDERWPMK